MRSSPRGTAVRRIIGHIIGHVFARQGKLVTACVVCRLLSCRREFQANHRDEWLACVRKAFDGLACKTDGKIREDQIVALLRDKLPEEEVRLTHTYTHTWTRIHTPQSVFSSFYETQFGLDCRSRPHQTLT